MSSTAAGAPSSSRRRIRLWVAFALIVLLAGTGGSILAARSVAAGDTNRVNSGFVTSTAQITATLRMTIQHVEDLNLSAAAFVNLRPHATDAEFSRWANTVQAMRHFPELLGIAKAELVPLADLPAFARLAKPDGSFHVTPAGVRAYYCFAITGVTRIKQAGYLANYDFCAGGAGALGLKARDTGEEAYLPRTILGTKYLIVLSPAYSGAVLPTTTATRRAAFVGWLGTEVVPSVMLSSALAGHADFGVSLTYSAHGSKVAFSSRQPRRHERLMTTSLHNGWTVRTFGPVPSEQLQHNTEALLILAGGIALTVLFAALVLVLATGRVRALSLVGEKTDELRHLALHDPLTGLPNRTLIMDRVDRLLARGVRDDISGAALYVDLDGFKNVNDTLGHGTGDKLLVAVASRMTATLRGVDTIGRLGGDEFVVLIDGAAQDGTPEMVAERLLEVLRQPFQLDGVPTLVHVTATIGIAIGRRETSEQLLHEADLALYQAKAAGKSRYEVFHPELRATVEHQHSLEFELRDALGNAQFVLYYQPIYALDDLTLVAVEALLRWEHPTLGSIPPAEFVPLLESSSQIIEVGRWVLLEACTQMADWHKLGSPLSVSVNLSAGQLDRDAVVDEVRDALRATGLDPGALMLEVSESSLTSNIDATARRLRSLKDLGVGVAIDNFGTGYSSLAYLQRFPVDCLKIDPSFTASGTRSPQSEAIVRTLVQLGKELGIKTLVEGVETPAQIDYLRGQHVNEIQGFLLAQPLTRQAFETQIFEPAHAIDPNAAHR